jgi:hypothetical protein
LQVKRDALAAKTVVEHAVAGALAPRPVTRAYAHTVTHLRKAVALLLAAIELPESSTFEADADL